MGFLKLDAGILDSTLWAKRDPREVFITALLMAMPHELREPTPQLRIRNMDETGFIVPPGWYGFVEASGPGIVRRAVLPPDTGLDALEALGEPDPESRGSAFEGRRLVRIDGGFVVLNFMAYRDKDHSGAERARRYRARKSVTRDGVTVTRDITQSEAEADAEADAEAATSLPLVAAADARAKRRARAGVPLDSPDAAHRSSSAARRTDRVFSQDHLSEQKSNRERDSKSTTHARARASTHGKKKSAGTKKKSALTSHSNGVDTTPARALKKRAKHGAIPSAILRYVQREGTAVLADIVKHVVNKHGTQSAIYAAINRLRADGRLVDTPGGLTLGKARP